MRRAGRGVIADHRIVSEIAVELLLGGVAELADELGIDHEAHRDAPGQRDPPEPAVLEPVRVHVAGDLDLDALEVGVQRGVAPLAIEDRDAEQARNRAAPTPGVDDEVRRSRQHPARQLERLVAQADLVGVAHPLEPGRSVHDLHAGPRAPPPAGSRRSDREARCRNRSCGRRALRRSGSSGAHPATARRSRRPSRCCSSRPRPRRRAGARRARRPARGIRRRRWAGARRARRAPRRSRHAPTACRAWPLPVLRRGSRRSGPGVSWAAT